MKFTRKNFETIYKDFRESSESKCRLEEKYLQDTSQHNLDTLVWCFFGSKFGDKEWYEILDSFEMKKFDANQDLTIYIDGGNCEYEREVHEVVYKLVKDPDDIFEFIEAHKSLCEDDVIKRRLEELPNEEYETTEEEEEEEEEDEKHSQEPEKEPELKKVKTESI